jgi:enamine deaminase RidA (YjgF/YER057c/UK114 family)
MTAEQRVTQLGLIIPPPPAPRGNYVPGIVHNGLLYISGQGPIMEDGELATGIVGKDLTLEQGYEHAKRCGMMLLAIARHELGSLDRVERVLNVQGMVNAAPDFLDHPKVINGCSDLLYDVFGEAGRHTRAAVGMGSLPFRISVEITAIMAVKD